MLLLYEARAHLEHRAKVFITHIEGKWSQTSAEQGYWGGQENRQAFPRQEEDLRSLAWLAFEDVGWEGYKICVYKYIAEEVKELFKQNDNVNSRTSAYKQATMKFRLKLEEGF